MVNPTQIERLKAVRKYIETHIHEDIRAEHIAEVGFYSYRNINRIFKAVYQESVGAFVKRMQLEALAKMVLYTDKSITEIAFEADFHDLQSFNKAFRSVYGCSPMQFRKKHQAQEKMWLAFNKEKLINMTQDISYRLETLPDLRVLYLPYHGEYTVSAIRQSWQGLLEFAEKQNLLSEQTLFLGEILDDEDITQAEKCRYNCAISLEKEVPPESLGFLDIKIIPGQKYAVFNHKGSDESVEQTYELIYGHWLMQNAFELVDRPVLEFYLNHEAFTPEEERLTDIYIPIQ